MENEKETLVSLGVMARLTHVTTSWLRKEADSDRIPHIKAGDRYVFEPNTVKRILLERAKKGVIDE